jgi:recombinational DNA repair ATPase RecF
MYVSTLSLFNIRCFELAEFNFSPGISLLVGENNAGKTTAIYALMTLQRPKLVACNS